MKNIQSLIPNGLMALLMVVFGLNKFFGFIAVDPPADATAQAFMGAMFSTYLFKVVALFEIVGGLLLLVPKTRLLAWLLLSPVIFNIVAFHLAHDFVGNGIWLLPTILFIYLGFLNRSQLEAVLRPIEE